MFGRETFIVRVAEDAMAPRVRAGDYVWVDPDEPAAAGRCPEHTVDAGNETDIRGVVVSRHRATGCVRASRAGRASTTWTSCSRSSLWRTWRVRRPSPRTRETTWSRSGARSCRRGPIASRSRGCFQTGYGPPLDSCGTRWLAPLAHKLHRTNNWYFDPSRSARTGPANTAHTRNSWHYQ